MDQKKINNSMYRKKKNQKIAKIAKITKKIMKKNKIVIYKSKTNPSLGS